MEGSSHGRDHLAIYHQTISQQLNARLEESPRFFWALVVVSTGYGYVLWDVTRGSKPTQPELPVIFIIASLLSFFAVLWASWYLAALGYAFRYLQNIQHCIEHRLGWNIYGPEGSSPPTNIRRCSDIFWLLPGIYHAHKCGLVLFLVIIISAFSLYSSRLWGVCCSLLLGFASLFTGIGFIIYINWHYLRKFKKHRKDPATIN